eukprot:XP_011535443.1 zinc finger and BTB domain-containing protein 25 isoform X5 [Homo sapiens]
MLGGRCGYCFHSQLVITSFLGQEDIPPFSIFKLCLSCSKHIRFFFLKLDPSYHRLLWHSVFGVISCYQLRRQRIAQRSTWNLTAPSMFQQLAPASPQGIKFGILSLETQVLAELLILSQDSVITTMDTASHSLVLLQQLNMQREFGFLCDCTVAIGDVYFKAHRAVLAAFSNYFKMIFIHQTSECIKIQPTDIQPDIFSYLLHIMYTGKGPKQIVDHSRLEEGIRFLHADYLSHIATEMNQVFSPETVQSSNLYGIQISTTQKTVVKQGLEVKEAPSSNSGNRAAVQGDHPQLQLSLAIGLDDGTADQQRACPATQALEEHQKPPVSIKQERCDPESVISQSHPSPSSEVTGPTFTENSVKIHLCHYCGERFDSRSNLRQHLHTHVSGSLPFGVPASILESNDLGEVHPLNENSEALECRRLSSFIVKENEQQPDHTNRGKEK